MMFTWIFYFITFIITIILLLYVYSTRNYNYFKKKNIWHKKPIPFFGNFLPCFLTKKVIGEWLKELYNEVNEDLYGVYIFDQPVIVLKSPKLIKAVMQKDFSHFEDRTVVINQYDPVMKHLIFFSKHPTWKPVRAKLSPVFTSGKLKLMFPLILNEAQDMIQYISKRVNIPNIEAKEICAKYSTNVIARCAFAINAQSFQNEDAEFRNITREMFAFRFVTAARQFAGFLTPNLVKIFRIQIFNKRLLSSMKTIFRDVLQERKLNAHLRNNDLIDILLETNRKSGDSVFSDDAILGHAIQFFAAGFETVSATVSFALYELALHPEIQDKLRKEIEEHTISDGTTYAGISEMKYLDMVVSEVLRKYPVLNFLDRVCREDYKIEGTDIVIEKGMPVYIPIFGVHFDPQYFPNPEKFDPERFADKTKINNNGLYYIPFGEGPRICIGERFGLLGVKVALVSILQKFKVEPSDRTPVPIKFEAKSLVLQSTVGLPMKFVPV